MKERSRNIMVGLTTLAGMATLAVLLLLFGYVPSFIAPGYMVHAHLPSTQGLNDASRVWLYGVDVGTVESIELAPFPKRGVTVGLRLKEEISIPQGTVIVVNAPLFGGTPSISLDTSQVPEGKDIAYLPKDGSATIEPSSVPVGLESRVAKELRGALESATNNLQKELSTRLDSYDKLVAKIDDLSTEWTQVASNLNQITSPRTPQEVDEGKGQGNLSSVVMRLDDRIKELQTGVTALNQWVNDEKLREDVKTTVANARKLTEKMDASLDQVNKVTASADQNIDKLATRFVASADDLSAAIDSMQKTIDAFRAGKGTAGKLINDPAVYDNLNDAILRIGKAADEFKVMMEKFRKEGLPLSL